MTVSDRARTIFKDAPRDTMHWTIGRAAVDYRYSVSMPYTCQSTRQHSQDLFICTLGADEMRTIRKSRAKMCWMRKIGRKAENPRSSISLTKSFIDNQPRQTASAMSMPLVYKQQLTPLIADSLAITTNLRHDLSIASAMRKLFFESRRGAIKRCGQIQSE